jgi:plasmid maintenance system antidote protein VapI
MTHPVDKYLEETGQRRADLARLVGCSKGHLSNVLNGEKRCSLALALAISSQTGVSPQDLHDAYLPRKDAA